MKGVCLGQVDMIFYRRPLHKQQSLVLKVLSA